MNDNDTFDMFSEYPNRPGWKRQETSAEAAEAVAKKAPVLRARCLAEISAASNGLTGNELAERLGWDITSVRPRISELLRLGRVRKRMDGDRPARRSTPSGCSALVWEAVEQMERAA